MHPSRVATRSPFLVIPEFISPLTCEELIGEVNFNVPTMEHETNKPDKTILTNPIASRFLENIWASYCPQISNYYGAEFLGEDSVESIAFEWFPEGLKSKGAVVDGHTKVGDRWMKSSSDDFYAVLFLMNYNDGKTGEFDDYDEVVGGKLEFPYFKFGFNPKAGMLVMWPSAPNFACGTSEIYAGDLYQARFRLTTKHPFKYAPNAFPGTFQDWF